eukprot:744250-Amphidinium_carterae.1
MILKKGGQIGHCSVLLRDAFCSPGTFDLSAFPEAFGLQPHGQACNVCHYSLLRGQTRTGLEEWQDLSDGLPGGGCAYIWHPYSRWSAQKSDAMMGVVAQLLQQESQAVLQCHACPAVLSVFRTICLGARGVVVQSIMQSQPHKQYVKLRPHLKSLVWGDSVSVLATLRLDSIGMEGGEADGGMFKEMTTRCIPFAWHERIHQTQDHLCARAAWFHTCNLYSVSSDNWC